MDQVSTTKPDGMGHAGASGLGMPFPGDRGVWFFIVADMGMFALFFLLFMVGQAQDPDTYRQSRTLLAPQVGLLNTLILVTSGWLMARAVESARKGNWDAARRGIIGALVVGMGFAVTKMFEYWDKISHGITIQTNEFFTYYFAFTGLHFLHFVVGVGVLIATLGKIRQADDAVRLNWIESAGNYWHMVDLLWMILFPMLYLAGGGA